MTVTETGGGGRAGGSAQVSPDACEGRGEEEWLERRKVWLRVLDRAAVTCRGNPTWAGSRHGGVNRRLCPLPNYFVTTWVLLLPPRKRSLPPGQPCFYVLYLMSCFQPAHPGCGVDIGNWLSPWRSPTLQANHFPIPNDKIKSFLQLKKYYKKNKVCNQVLLSNELNLRNETAQFIFFSFFVLQSASHRGSYPRPWLSLQSLSWSAHYQGGHRPHL